MAWSNCSLVCSARGTPEAEFWALLIKKSMRPKVSAACFTTAATCSSTPPSAWQASTFTP